MIPLRSSLLKLSSRWPKSLIIHHSNCLVDHPFVNIDKNKFQADKYQTLNYIKYKKETRFHFIIEKVGNDFQVIASQPMMTLCEFPDIDISYQDSVHIALLGNYNIDIPEKRLYLVLSYRLLNPLMRLFALNEYDILFHNEISIDSDVNCPGEFVDKPVLLSILKSVRKRKTLTRG